MLRSSWGQKKNAPGNGAVLYKQGRKPNVRSKYWGKNETKSQQQSLVTRRKKVEGVRGGGWKLGKKRGRGPVGRRKIDKNVTFLITE